MTYPQGVWVENPSGYQLGSWMYSGPVLFLPSNDAANTGMGVLILGPGGGKANFPVMMPGPAGEPIIVDSASATTLSYGSTPTVAFNLVSPGGSGTAAHYTVSMGIPAGEPGASSSFELQNATDLTVGTPAVGMVPMVSSLSPTAFTLTAPHAAVWKSGGPFSGTASNVNTIKNLGSVAIPPQLTANWIEVSGQMQTIGAVDTQVNIVARIGNYTTGTIISYALGQAGASPAPTLLIPQGLSSTAGILAASTSATIFLNAENQTASANPWSVAAGSTVGVKLTPTT